METKDTQKKNNYTNKIESQVYKRKIWTPYSWRSYSISQQPIYSHKNQVEEVLERIKSERLSISSYEAVNKLRAELSSQDKFILIAGDCSEPLEDCEREVVYKKCAFLNYLGNLLSKKYQKEVVLLGRLAGQFGKPRSSNVELIDQKEYMTYRGDIVNSFDSNSRNPDPERLYLGALTAGKIKKQVTDWNATNNERTSKGIENREYEQDWYKELYSLYKEEWEKIYSQKELVGSTSGDSSVSSKDSYEESPSQNSPTINNKKAQLSYSDNNSNSSNLNICIPGKTSPIYTCHEGLLLNYESSFTYENSINNKFYNLSAELLWIGERTNNIKEAHVEYFRGLENPIGIKVSARTSISDLVDILKLLNPENQSGKILLITRVGNSVKGRDYLENLVKKIKESNISCSFICDPMHGNTELMSSFKTRRLGNLLEEVNSTIEILKKNGMSLNGIHIEATPFDVTECVETDILEVKEESYTTKCDPRLNLKQSVKLLSSISDMSNK